LDLSAIGFAIAAPRPYLCCPIRAPLHRITSMPTKPIELPPAVAKAFVRDMRAFFGEENQLKRDEIAARQLYALAKFRRPRERNLRLADVKEMFRQMRDHA